MYYILPSSQGPEWVSTLEWELWVSSTWRWNSCPAQRQCSRQPHRYLREHSRGSKPGGKRRNTRVH